MFDKSPGAAYGIVLEEDMVVSPDFLTYFLRLAPAMDADPSLFCISAYNDNGLDHLAEDSTLVYRTEWFVGLGWLIKRCVYGVEPEVSNVERTVSNVGGLKLLDLDLELYVSKFGPGSAGLGFGVVGWERWGRVRGEGGLGFRV